MTTYPSVWDDFWAILRAVWQITTKASEKVQRAARAAEERYRPFMLRWLARFLAAGLLTVGLLLTLSLSRNGPAWIFSLGTLLLGALVTLGLILTSPYLLALAVSQRIWLIGPEIQRVLGWVTIAAFSAIVFAIASQVLPLWQNPDKLLLLVLVIAGSVLGAKRGLVLIPKAYVARVITGGLMMLLLFTIISLIAPRTLSRLRKIVALEEPLPRVLVIDLEGGSPLRSAESRKPVAWSSIWFIRRRDGAFELFDRSGLDPRTGSQLEYLDKPEERTEILGWIEQLREAKRLRADSLAVTAAARAGRVADSTRKADNALRARNQEIVQQSHDDSIAKVEADAVAARARQDSLDVEIDAVEALARGIPGHRVDAHPEWARELLGKSIFIRFSPASRQLAAAFLQRLRSVGVEVVLAPILVGSSDKLASTPALDYTQADLHAAKGLSAVLGDLGWLDLNSHRAYTPLRITLP